MTPHEILIDTKDRLSPCSCTRIHPQQCPHGSDTLPTGVYCAAVGLSTKDRLAGPACGPSLRLEKRQAYFTYSPGAYYFAPTFRTAPPYREQRYVTAIIDVANDGTLAGVELVLGELPPPPSRYKAYDPDREQRIRELVEAAHDIVTIFEMDDEASKPGTDTRLSLDRIRAALASAEEDRK